MDWYKKWFRSPFYKILYQNRDENEAQDFIENLLGYLHPAPGSAMLDIACGEGRYAKQLAEHNYDVTGIDLSMENIESAKEWESDNLHFYNHDMRMPFYINYFDFAFNFFTSFGYFSHDRDHALAAKSFTAALKSEGILVIDYMNATNVIANLVPEETIIRDNQEFRITRKLERNHIVKDIYFTDENNVPKQFSESVAAFNLSDFIKLFSPGAVSLVTTFGDYQLGPYNQLDSPRLIMVFKKKYD
jgi:SAM-dependent methyltransferase